MGSYIYAYVMPKGDRTRFVQRCVTYRVWPFYEMYTEAEGVEEIETPTVIFNTFDTRFSQIMSAERYLEIAQAYRDKMDADRDGSGDEPMYIDDMTLWLRTLRANGGHIDDIDILLVSEI